MNVRIVLFAGLAICYSSPVIAQDACIALLRHGIYDKWREIGANQSASQTSAQICKAYHQYQQDSKGAGAHASYGLANGSATFTQEQISALGQTMCSSETTAAQASSNLSVMQDNVSDAGLQAFGDCMHAYEQGLQVKTDYREEDQAHIDISIHYSATGVSNAIELTHVVIDPPNVLKCDGDLLESVGKKLGPEAVSISCERVMWDKPAKYLDREVYAPPSTITIMTTAGNVVRSFAASPVAPAASIVDELRSKVEAVHLVVQTRSFSTNPNQEEDRESCNNGMKVLSCVAVDKSTNGRGCKNIDIVDDQTACRIKCPDYQTVLICGKVTP